MDSNTKLRAVTSIFPHRNLPFNALKIDAGTFIAIKLGTLEEDTVVEALVSALPTWDLSKKKIITYLSYLARNIHSKKIALVSVIFLLSKQVLSPKELRSLTCVSCYDEVAVLVQEDLLKHSNVSNDHLRYLSQWGLTLDIALRAVKKLSERSNDKDAVKHLRSIFIESGAHSFVKHLAEEAILGLPIVLLKDKKLASYRRIKLSKTK